MKRIPLEKVRYAKKIVVANLPGMKSIIRVETARLVKWFHVLPATGDGDAMCLLIQQAPKWELIENIEKRIIAEESARYASQPAGVQSTGHPIQTMKATKISSYKGTTVYLTESYNIRVTRKTISERAGCGLRKNTSVCGWYAIDRNDPAGRPSHSGYGGIRDAMARLSKLTTAQAIA
jgi:hypothetical protein